MFILYNAYGVDWQAVISLPMWNAVLFSQRRQAEL